MPKSKKSQSKVVKCMICNHFYTSMTGKLGRCKRCRDLMARLHGNNGSKHPHPDGHEERIALYAQRVANRLPLFG